MDNTNNNSTNSFNQASIPTGGANPAPTNANPVHPGAIGTNPAGPNPTSTPATNPASTTTPTNNPNLDNLSDEEVIDLFIRGIMEEKGVNPPTEEIRQSIFNDLRAQLLEQIDRSLVGELPDDKLNELSAMAMKNGEIDPTLIAQKINEANLDIAEITGVTMQRFRELYLGDKLEKQPLNSQTEA